MLSRCVQLTVVECGFVGQVKRRGGGVALARVRDDGAAAGAALDHVVATGDLEVAGRPWWRRRRQRQQRRRGRRRRRRIRRRQRGRQGRHRAGSLADVLAMQSAKQVVPLARATRPAEPTEHQAVLVVVVTAIVVDVIGLADSPVGIRQWRVGWAPHPNALGRGICAANPHLVVTRSGD